MNFFEFTVGTVGTVRALAQRALKKAAARPFIDTDDPVRRTVSILHPPALDLVVSDVFEHGPDGRTFRLVPTGGKGDRLPPFRAGQYLSIKGTWGGACVSRPYSISSAPYEALLATGGYYEITVKRQSDGLVSPHIFSTWQKATRVSASGPHGEFYHEPLRDAGDIVAIAGGSGITPFLSMAREIIHGDMEARLVILYGVRTMDEALFEKELIRLAGVAPDRLRVCYVVSEPDGTEKCATGFIDEGLIKKEIGDISDKSFFVCGPQALYAFFNSEAQKLTIPRRRIRWEVSGPNRVIGAHPAFPKKATGREYALVVYLDRGQKTVPARAEEPILVALERAGIAADSRCRSGQCGICRAELISGEVFIDPENDARRRVDKEYGFIHSCSTYPVGDCTIRIVSPEVLTG
ncbi:MAG: 2Fe-2S iron-sulfur cluster binding domain-containing protein [Deltaproteobacteria bacterium]|nr:2Fe-2S iron-sulfur cluster binding domain-containing protein [Candidatus Zymogenaceae bacterium]